MKAIVMHSWKFTHFLISSNRFSGTDVLCRTKLSRVELFLRSTFIKTSIYKKYKRNTSKYLFMCVGREFQKDL